MTQRLHMLNRRRTSSDHKFLVLPRHIYDFSKSYAVKAEIINWEFKNVSTEKCAFVYDD